MSRILMALFSIMLATLSYSANIRAAGPADRSETASVAASPPPPLELADTFTAVLSRFIGAETAPVKATDDRWHVVYELWLTNGKQVPAAIEKIEVLNFDDLDQVVYSLAGDDLLAALFQLSTRPAPDAVLEPNESVLVFFELAFSSIDAVPDRIVHRLTATGADNPGSREPVAIEYLISPWDISERSPPVISPPLTGGGWVAINGCCSGRGAHRGAIQTVNGTLMDSQRYAIDWMRLDAEKRLVKGDPARVENWFDYDMPVFAVANATVVSIVNNLPDQVPGKLPDPLSITLATVDGNHIILDLGNGLYAFYAHLKTGTIGVAPGDKVTAGQEIARLGNSGNTSAPHLHFHLMTRPSAIVSDGIPYQFDRFEVEGAIAMNEWLQAEDIFGQWTMVATDIPGARTNVLPLDLRVIRFPD